MRCGSGVCNRVQVALRPVLQHAVQLISTLIKESVKIQLDIDENLPDVLGDEGRIEQVFYGCSCYQSWDDARLATVELSSLLWNIQCYMITYFLVDSNFCPDVKPRPGSQNHYSEM